MDLKGHKELLSKLRTKYPEAIWDGAVNEDSWNELSDNRILWILKEPHGKIDPPDLRYLLRQFANNSNPNGVCATWKRTYGLVVKVSYGIINGCCEWKQWAAKVDDIRTILNKIAVININKYWGGSAAVPKVLAESAEEFLDVIIEQIKLLDPEVVILGLGNARESLHKKVPITGKHLWDSFKYQGRKYIIAYHPGQRTKGMTHERYYDIICKELSK